MITSPLFTPIKLVGRNLRPDGLESSGCMPCAVRHCKELPLGGQAYWGIPFDCGDAYAYVRSGSGGLTLNCGPFSANFIVFLHASESPSQARGEDGMYKHLKGIPPLMTDICEYTLIYDDGGRAALPVRSRMEISDMEASWGHNPFLARAHMRGRALNTASDDIAAGRKPDYTWGASQYRARAEGEGARIMLWLCAYENPRRGRAVTGIEITPLDGNVFLFGVTAGDVEENPLRYGSRRKALLPLEGDAKDPLSLVDIDLGHIISVIPQLAYGDNWADPSANVDLAYEYAAKATGKYLVEFDAHADAALYYNKWKQTRVRDIGAERDTRGIPGTQDTPGAQSTTGARDITDIHAIYVAPAEKYVTVKVVNESGATVPVRIHAHGAAGEYLPPRNRHRIPNAFWFEDYSADLAVRSHWSTYIDGEADYLLPLGDVFFEACKGFEVKPVRVKAQITPQTDEIVIKTEQALDWRKRGWVTADTHVHFLSAQTALLEGEAEGVHVVNILASQWGELFTNIGDFTGNENAEATRGEYMVKVGTENRQRIMGHISLLGYGGKMILPLTTGGPDESALGDPMEITLTQWAEQCRKQGGLSVLPHFPGPRAEYAAAIVSEFIDAVETVPGWGIRGINPYYLSDWYRYLNCGYNVAAVGGTDKMGAYIAIGEMRTYAKLLPTDVVFTYDAWKRAVTAGRTFATCGALADISVEGHGLGENFTLDSPASLTVDWTAASATIPLTSVELVMNGETVEKVSLDSLLGEQKGYFTIDTRGSAWFALRLRGKLHGSEVEIITAHTSAIFVIIGGKPLFNAPDAATILDQIEGVTAYVTTLGTKAQEQQFKLALAALSGAHRALHNRMHAQGSYHKHIEGQAEHEGHENK